MRERSATLTSGRRPVGLAVGERQGSGSLAGSAFEPHHCFACGELNEHGLHLAPVQREGGIGAQAHGQVVFGHGLAGTAQEIVGLDALVLEPIAGAGITGRRLGRGQTGAARGKRPAPFADLCHGAV